MSAQVESLCVVVVDDERMFLELFGAHLQRSGHRASFFSSADEALKHCKANRVDVIIADREMPGLSGLEFARAIRELGLKIPIGMASCGVVDLLPFQKAEILQHVDSLEEKSEVLRDVGGFVEKLHQLGQARQNSGQYPQKTTYVQK